MPTTECRCNTCGHTFVHLFFKGDAIQPVCPRCRQRDVTVNTAPERLMNEPGIGSLIVGVPKGPS